MKFLKILLLLLGVAILYDTVQSVGTENLLNRLDPLKWNLLPIALVYLFVYGFNTLGWMFAFPKNLPFHVPFWSFFTIRVIGETMNAVIPFAGSLGGEPIKADLLKRKHGVSLSESYASLLIVHTTLWVSLNLFVMGALAVTFTTMPLTPFLKKAVSAALFSLAVGAALLFAGLHLGIFQKVHRIGETLKIWKGDLKERLSKFVALDAAIKRFYTANGVRFLGSSFFNLAAWLAGVLELFLITRILGLPISLAEAWLFEALVQVLRIATFFIPSSIGAQEGGIVFIFTQFGYAAPLALAFALVRRIREMIWIAIGLYLWGRT